MRKHKYIGIIILILFIIPTILHAANFNFTTQSIGGRISSDPTALSASIVCTAAYGPFMMTPFNLAVSGPFFIRSAIHGTPRIHGYLLGTYSIIPDLGTCTNPESGTPVPAFEIKLYNVSR